MPAPEIELTVTSTLLPLPAETDAIVPLALPVEVRLKSLVSILTTDSLNVALKVTLVALPAGEPVVAILDTVGITLSTKTPVKLPTEFSVVVRSLPPESFMVPELREIAAPNAMPSASVSPLSTL